MVIAMSENFRHKNNLAYLSLRCLYDKVVARVNKWMINISNIMNKVCVLILMHERT